jgi:hypothetical protein
MATYTPNTKTPNYGSEQQWLIHFTVTSVPGNAPTSLSGVYSVSSSGTTLTFDKFSGGDVMSTSVKHRPGGMGHEVSYLSLPTFSDVVISKVYETQNDHLIIADLHHLVGRAKCTVTLTPLDDEGNPYTGTPNGTTTQISPRSYFGRLISVKDGGADSMSSAVRMYEIDISVETIGN